jgi:hypothetical protein
MNKFALAVSVAVGLGLQSAAYAASDTTRPVPVFATSTYAFGTLSYGRSSADSSPYIGCAVYPNTTTNAYTEIECKARSVAGSNFWCYIFNPSSTILSALANANESSFLQFGSDRQSHCTYITATTIAESPERVAQRRDALQAIDVLIARGEWGNEELRQFHEKLGVLDPPQAELALQKLASAVKSGGLHADAGRDGTLSED